MKIPKVLLRGALTIKVEKNRSISFPRNATAHHPSIGCTALAALELQNQHPSRRRYESSTPQYRIVGLLDKSFASRSGSSPSLAQTRRSSSVSAPPAISDDERPMTVRERVFTFPGSVMLLWKDWLLYKNIRDAAATKRNAWTKQEYANQAFSQDTNATVSIYEISSVVPWRQREQQRRFIDSLSTVLPTVVVWLLPIIGYIPMFLSIAAPRQLLSRHFFNQYEIVHFNRLAYMQRNAYFASVRDLAPDGKRSIIANETIDTSIHQHALWPGNDALEPLPMVVHHVHEWFVSIHRPSTNDTVRSSQSTVVQRWSRPYLVTFALAAGVFQTIPTPWNARLAHWSPSWWLQRQIRHMAETIADDDRALWTLLCEEERSGTTSSALHTLSDIEVMDASLLRGLSVCNVTFAEMRVGLANHLRLLESLVQLSDYDPYSHSPQHSKRWSDEALGLFSLHLAILRDHGTQKT